MTTKKKSTGGHAGVDRRAAALKAARTRKLRAAGVKAAVTKRRRAAAVKAAATRRKRT